MGHKKLRTKFQTKKANEPDGGIKEYLRTAAERLAGDAGGGSSSAMAAGERDLLKLPKFDQAKAG